MLAADRGRKFLQTLLVALVAAELDLLLVFLAQAQLMESQIQAVAVAVEGTTHQAQVMAVLGS